MSDNLARFERLARQAAERRTTDLRAQGVRDRAAREEASRQTPEYLAGPPDGCGDCWEWSPHPSFPLAYSWWHGAPVVHEVHPWALCEDGAEEPTDFCMHACHGPDGYPLPVIAYA